ncbi:hypothetical protein SLA2020_002310 [Shorea laevis]
MDAETSCFETSEILATFLASTPVLLESWRLCDLANRNSQGSFLMESIGSVCYVAFSGFSGIQEVSGSDRDWKGLVPLDANLFDPLNRCGEGEGPIMVHEAMLNLFLSVYHCPNFQTQMSTIMERCKSMVITGHSLGGTTASLLAICLLCQSMVSPSPLSVLCVTFGSPLLGNEALHRVILRERWGGNFCHIVSKHDIMPRLLLAPVASLNPQLQILLHFWHLSMTHRHFGLVASQLNDEIKSSIFCFVLSHLEALVHAEGSERSPFWPFGSYVLCTHKGAICVDNANSVVKLMHLMLVMSSPNCAIEDHLNYRDYVEKAQLQFLKARNFLQRNIYDSSYEAGVALALESLEITTKELMARMGQDCLKMARRMGRTPNLNCANLAIRLSKITPYRAEIEWYKACCDQADDQMGYYDSFKLRGASKRDSRVNMNRHKLAGFWNSVIYMLENNQLPYDFLRREKWVNAAQFYKLLVEPLDIAEYYRTGMHHIKGHYRTQGRERRYQIFDKWWHDRRVAEEGNKKRSKFASLTQDSCFWAKVEEARELLDNIRCESDVMKRVWLCDEINDFERYAKELIESKEVSKDVLVKNSSYSLWMEEWRELKSQMQQFPSQFPSFLDGEVVP